MRRNRRPQRGAVPLQPQVQKASVKERLASVPWQQVLYLVKLLWRHAVAVVGLGFLLWVFLSLPNFFTHYQVKEVTVEGVTDQRRVDMVHEHLKQVLSTENFFSLALEDLHQDLEDFGWVAHVDIRRQWPGVLRLQFKEIQPVAVWNDNRLISVEGKRFEGVDKYNITHLPKLFGPEHQYDEVLAMYQHMSGIVAKAGFNITNINVDARFTTTLTLNEYTEVVVDRHHNMNKLQRFVGLYQRTLGNNEQPVKRVDLRYADGMAVTWGDAFTATEKRGS